jgi:hypothetical protein
MDGFPLPDLPLQGIPAFKIGLADFVLFSARLISLPGGSLKD